MALPDEKVVIFSQWEPMTRLVIPILEERNKGFEYLHEEYLAKTVASFMPILPMIKIVKYF
ncbi:MAG TPA: hypothetical protein VIJ57_08695 [Hanamia sp.]